MSNQYQTKCNFDCFLSTPRFLIIIALRLADGAIFDLRHLALRDNVRKTYKTLTNEAFMLKTFEWNFL